LAHAWHARHEPNLTTARTSTLHPRRHRPAPFRGVANGPPQRQRVIVSPRAIASSVRAVFTRKIEKTGERIPCGDWRKTWRKARAAAGPPHALIHDCRRTVVRNLICAGAHERTAMSYTGHKTRAVFDRYDIQSLDDLKAASAALARHVAKDGSGSS